MRMTNKFTPACIHTLECSGECYTTHSLCNMKVLVHFGNIHLGLLQHIINGLFLKREVCGREGRGVGREWDKGTGGPPVGRAGALPCKGLTEDQLAPEERGRGQGNGVREGQEMDKEREWGEKRGRGMERNGQKRGEEEEEERRKEEKGGKEYRGQ